MVSILYYTACLFWTPKVTQNNNNNNEEPDQQLNNHDSTTPQNNQENYNYNPSVNDNNFNTELTVPVRILSLYSTLFIFAVNY